MLHHYIYTLCILCSLQKRLLQIFASYQLSRFQVTGDAWSLKFSIPGFFLVGNFGKYFLGVLI